MKDTEYEPRDDEIFFTIEDEEYCAEELILAKLLIEDVIFANQRQIKEFNNETTIILFVVMNDTFYYSCADADSIALEELPNLYRLYKKHGINGVTAWAIPKRKMRPLKPIEDSMREDGSWDKSFDKYPDWSGRFIWKKEE